MFAVTYKYEDIEDTATMSDDTETKAVFHAGIAMGLQYLEVTDAGLVLEMMAPGTVTSVLDQLDKFVNGCKLVVSEI